MTITVWVIVALLILANTFYVAGEFAAVGVRRSRVRRMSEDGNVLARQLLPFVQHPAELDRYVAVSQVGITLSSLILGAVGQAHGGRRRWRRTWPRWPGSMRAQPRPSGRHRRADRADRRAGRCIGELIPKSIALQFPTEVALATVLPMRWSLAAFRPFITLLNGSATGLLRLFGMNVGGTSPSALAGRDRAAHRRKPRRRPARARRTAAAAHARCVSAARPRAI